MGLRSTVMVIMGGLWMAAASAQSSPLPKASSGHIERLADFASRLIPARNVEVWLPEGYGSGPRCQVIQPSWSASGIAPTTVMRSITRKNSWPMPTGARASTVADD